MLLLLIHDTGAFDAAVSRALCTQPQKQQSSRGFTGRFVKCTRIHTVYTQCVLYDGTVSSDCSSSSSSSSRTEGQQPVRASRNTVFLFFFFVFSSYWLAEKCIFRNNVSRCIIITYTHTHVPYGATTYDRRAGTISNRKTFSFFSRNNAFA